MVACLEWDQRQSMNSTDLQAPTPDNVLKIIDFGIAAHFEADHAKIFAFAEVRAVTTKGHLPASARLSSCPILKLARGKGCFHSWGPYLSSWFKPSKC